MPSIQTPPRRRYPDPMPYDPAYADQARHLCHLGATDHEIAEYLGVSVGTLNRWRFAHREFAEALVVGGELADARVACANYGDTCNNPQMRHCDQVKRALAASIWRTPIHLDIKIGCGNLPR